MDDRHWCGHVDMEWHQLCMGMDFLTKGDDVMGSDKKKNMLNRVNVRPVENGLANYNPNNELAQSMHQHPPAQIMPHNDEDGQESLFASQGGQRDNHQHIHIHMAQPQQQLSYSYRRTTTIYYGSNRGGSGLLGQTASPALPATEHPVANAIVKSVQLVVWLGASGLGVFFVGKLMKWW